MTVEVEYYRDICTNSLRDCRICPYCSDYVDDCEYYEEKRVLQVDGEQRRLIIYPCIHRKRMKTVKVKNTNNLSYCEGYFLQLGKETISCQDIEYLKLGNKVEIDWRGEEAK